MQFLPTRAMRPARQRRALASAHRPVTAVLAALDTVVFGGLIPLALLLIAPPPLREAAAGFVVLCPLMLGLTHGQKVGLCGAVLCAASLALAQAWHPEAIPLYPKVSAVTGLLAALFAGRARDQREARLRQLGALCEYDGARQAQQRTAYQALLIAHVDLERKLRTQSSIRTSMDRLVRECERVTGEGVDETRHLGQCILDIFRSAAPLQSAALFLRDSSGGLGSRAAAVIGAAQSQLATYPQLVQLQGADDDGALQADAASGRPLGIVALRDAQGQLQGALVIVDMGFDSIRPETFEHLCVLARHAAHSLARRVQPLVSPVDFHAALTQIGAAIQEGRLAGMSVSVLVCECPKQVEPSSFLAECVRAGRCIDSSWAAGKPGGPAMVINVLPLTDEQGAACFARRLETSVAERFSGAQLTYRAWTFAPDERDDPAVALDATLAALAGRSTTAAGACT